MHDAFSRLRRPERGVRLTPELVRKAFLQLRRKKSPQARNRGGERENNAFYRFFSETPFRPGWGRGDSGAIHFPESGRARVLGPWVRWPGAQARAGVSLPAGLGLLKDGLQVGLPFDHGFEMSFWESN